MPPLPILVLINASRKHESNKANPCWLPPALPHFPSFCSTPFYFPPPPTLNQMEKNSLNGVRSQSGLLIPSYSIRMPHHHSSVKAGILWYLHLFLALELRCARKLGKRDYFHFRIGINFIFLLLLSLPSDLDCFIFPIWRWEWIHNSYSYCSSSRRHDDVFTNYESTV